MEEIRNKKAPEITVTLCLVVGYNWEPSDCQKWTPFQGPREAEAQVSPGGWQLHGMHLHLMPGWATSARPTVTFCLFYVKGSKANEICKKHQKEPLQLQCPH